MNQDLHTISDFLPSEADAAELKRAVSYIMNFLVQEFPALTDLKKLLPRKPETVIAKSEVVPMQVLFKDEKYIAETIHILSQLADDAHLSGQTQVNTKLDGFSLTLRPSRSLSHKYNNNDTKCANFHMPLYMYISQVVVGDQLICKNIRGCKLWRQSEMRVNDCLSWACEVPGKT